jgi:hypothetical protein
MVAATTFDAWLSTQRIERQMATSIYDVFAAAFPGSKINTKVGRHILAKYCNETTSTGRTYWTSKIVAAEFTAQKQQKSAAAKLTSVPKISKAAAEKAEHERIKSIALKAIHDYFDAEGYYDIQDRIDEDDWETVGADLLQAVRNAYAEADIDRPIKMYRQKVLKLFEDYKPTMLEKTEKYWRQLLLHFSTSTITATLNAYANNDTLAIAKFNPMKAQIFQKWMHGDFNSNRPDLDAMRDAAVAKICATQDAIEQMRDEYHTIQSHSLLEEIQKAEERKNKLIAEVDAGVGYAPPLPDEVDA